MEGGRISDFIDSFSYQGVAVMFKGEKYFTDGVTSDQEGKHHNFFVIKVNENGEWLEDVLFYNGDTIADCVEAFVNAPIWDGKTLYEADQDLEWVDW